jgi:hypothetical protein
MSWTDDVIHHSVLLHGNKNEMPDVVSDTRANVLLCAIVKG